MKSRDAERALALGAGLVIVALTAAAFWLSYSHLAGVASAYGLQASPARTWAWPACLDLFIVAGELLMLRAALTKTVDPWAIGLTVVGSGGSIALNVAGVGTSAPLLAYVVAAVPPTAALLAFGALMRQVHEALSVPAKGVDVVQALAVEPVTVLVERADAAPVIKVPQPVPHLAIDKAWKAPLPAVPELPSAPAPELTAADFLARKHKVRADQIRAVADLLTEQPALSGKAAGEAIGTGDRYGRRVLTAAKELGGTRS